MASQITPQVSRQGLVRKQLFTADPYEGAVAMPAKYDAHGWNDKNPILSDIIGKLRPQRIIEVGTWKGASAIAMARARLRHDTDFEMICVDTWLGAPEFWTNTSDPQRYLSLQLQNGYPTVYYTFLNNMLCDGLQPYVTPFPATSFVAQRWFGAKQLQADMIYIDAAHEYEEVAADIRNWWKILRPGGIMIGDDYQTVWPGVIRAVEEAADTIPQFRRIGIFQEKWVVQKG